METPAPAIPAAAASVPLCVDLDGTLINTDLAIECASCTLKRYPGALPQLMCSLVLGGRARLKQELARMNPIDPATLPYRPEVVEFIREQRALGRPIVLATAADQSLADGIAKHLGLFDAVLASDGVRNLKGRKKLAAIQRQFPDGFDYIGDASVDLPIFAAARTALLVEPPAAVETAAKAMKQSRVLVPRRPHSGWAHMKLLRPHQWLKNCLVVLPLLTAHEVGNVQLLLLSAAAFLAFCFTASSVYVVNDLLDVADDRQHPTKKNRPLASGAVSPAAALLMLVFSLVVATTTAGVLLPVRFMGWLLFYFATSLAYCFFLKRKLLIDVFVLAGLYTLRILAGGAAVGVVISPWLMAFSMFLFTSLAFAKRVVELNTQAARGREKLSGRGYQSTDVVLLTVAGACAGFSAVLVLALYISSDAVRALYKSPFALWLICPLLMYWITRVWLLVGRGWMADDPIVFAVRDRVSWIAGALVLALAICASF